VATAESLHSQLVKIDSIIASEFATRPVILRSGLKSHVFR
jgi:hypothetical protein